MSNLKGECACGKFKVEVIDALGVGICHCTDCRKNGGATGTAQLISLRDHVHVSGGEPRVFHTTGESGQDVQRYFCGNCGSPLYANADRRNQLSFVRSGLFAPGSIGKPSMHIFTRNMEEWEVPVPDAQMIEGNPPVDG